MEKTEMRRGPKITEPRRNFRKIPTACFFWRRIPQQQMCSYTKRPESKLIFMMLIWSKKDIVEA